MANPQSLRQLAMDRGINPATVTARVRRGDTVAEALEVRLRNKPDLTGSKFGKLTVVRSSGSNTRGARTWLCRCDCGGDIDGVTTARLRNGASSSCGCKRRESTAEANKAKRSAPGESSANTLWWSYVTGAKKRGVQWNLSKQKFRELTEQDCFYCGHPPAKKIKSSNSWSHYIYNGIDRVDNDLGYDEENCVPCCTDCNKIKGRVSASIIKKAYQKLFIKES